MKYHTNLNTFSDLNDIGNVPYALARPFLLKIESPEKLVSRSKSSWPAPYLTAVASKENFRATIPTHYR
jgi:hypothetical protein